MYRYWITSHLAGGSIPEDERDYEDLRELGFKVIVSLVEDWEYEYYTGMSCDHVKRLVERLGMKLVRKPVPDGHAPDIESMLEICNLIKELEARCCKVLVHCVGGLGRTPTVLAAYLMYSRCLDLYTALRSLQRVNPEMELTETQFNALTRLEKFLRERRGSATSS